MNKTKNKVTKLHERRAHSFKPGMFFRETKRHNWTKVSSISRLTGYRVNEDGTREKVTKTIFNGCIVFNGTDELNCKIKS